MKDKTLCRSGHVLATVGRDTSGHCKSCQSQRFKEYRKRRPDVRRDTLYRSTFGISLVEWNAMFTAQNGLCAGCYRHQSTIKSRFCVDHDHATGKVRGLLCKTCNFALGYAHDAPATLRRLADYLEKVR